MRFKATLTPKMGEKPEQGFFASIEEARTWARKTIWWRHKKLVQQTEKGEVPHELTGPRVEIQESRLVHVEAVYPWHITDEDKKEELGV